MTLGVILLFWPAFSRWRARTRTSAPAPSAG